MRAWPVALLAAVLLTLSSPAEPNASAPADSSAAPLTVITTPSPLRAPAPEAISFVGVGLLAVLNLTLRKRPARAPASTSPHAPPERRRSGPAITF